MNREFLVGNDLDLSALESFKTGAGIDIAMAEEVVAPSAIDTTTSVREAIELSNKIAELEKYAGFTRWFQPGTKYGIDKLPKHAAFINSSSDYRQIYLSGGNRVGKTLSMAWMTACHLTGEYPDWYTGKRWNHPIDAWAAGDYNATTRDIIQLELLGRPGMFGTGMIPKDRIISTTSKTGTAGGVDTVLVQHVSGGVSSLQFKAYKQQNESFYGTAKHWIWLDELPPFSIFSECFTRTMTTQGIIVVTATPLEGMTDMVFNFYAEADFLPEGSAIPAVIKMARDQREQEREEARLKGEKLPEKAAKKAVICIGWDDAPWLSEDEKIEQLANCPPHLRQARSTGLPGDTGGKVFPIAMSDILVDDFPIPSHYRFINALDPGFHNTGAAFGALDPDTDTLYIYADYKRGFAEPVVHATAIKEKSVWSDAPVIFDYAGMGGRPEEEALRTQYKKYGLKLINADKAVESGIAAMWERMSTGRLKIFKSCKALQQEIVTYQRDEKNKIVKANDHIIDCARYMISGIKHARNKVVEGSGSFGRVKGNVSGVRYF